jgi:peptidoglycan/xylan/chitin deacetylase (PgdA/CDA1 family)
MATFVTGYDTEYVQDLDWSLCAVKAVAAVHRKHRLPATFFFVGKLLDLAGERYAAILGGDDLFDIQSHTYSHLSLKSDSPERLSAAEDELRRTADLIERYFGQRPLGICGPGGYEKGLKDCPKMLQVAWDSGARYVSTDGRGPGGTIPAPLTQPYWYAEQGFPALLELPAQDFHENVLKGYQHVPAYWPPVLPWGLPNRPPSWPEEEFAYFRQGLEYVAEHGLDYYRTYFHPWSVYRFDRNARTIDLLLGHAARIGMEVTSCTAYYRQLALAKA